MSVVVDEKYFAGREDELINAINREVHADSIHIEDDLALVAVVGRGMRSSTGTAAKVISAIANEGINIRMLDQGSSELNIIVGVDCSAFEKAVKAIYNAFHK